MIEVVQGAIKECEEAKKSWILQGFPRTKVQALALQKTGTIPDKIVHLKTSSEASIARIKQNLLANDNTLFGPELDALADQCYMEYQVNHSKV